MLIPRISATVYDIPKPRGTNSTITFSNLQAGFALVPVRVSMTVEADSAAKAIQAVQRLK